ncbi:hypothetical protein C8R30_11921 [Nitrosomonas nitrosa]|uniref:Uncharacterized protein n=1 Tax=Nitrosomonas nitrosa TaxID=52442 RepID=A0A1I4NMC0_9PROT|nr:hypothetical protein C8R30_11921 [Nitrosomonas nitrosa]SFM16682.1 hypothetical protein SAMN05421880_10868 [Nitrosomonas nitrosa]
MRNLKFEIFDEWQQRVEREYRFEPADNDVVTKVRNDASQ